MAHIQFDSMAHSYVPQPQGPDDYALQGGDCDDADPMAHPGMWEIPDDGIDNDCAGGDATLADLGNVIYVDGSYNGTEDGSADQPYSDLETAINVAPAGGVVAVAQGSYLADPYLDGDSVMVVGGYTPGATWVRDGGRGTTSIVPTLSYETFHLSGGATLVLTNVTVEGPVLPDPELGYGDTINSFSSSLTLVDTVVEGPSKQESGIHVYSTGYMKGDESYARYFAYLNLFVFSMLVLALHTAYLAAVFAGWGASEQQMQLALAAYATYVVNAAQFIWKLRMARLEGAAAS